MLFQDRAQTDAGEAHLFVGFPSNARIFLHVRDSELDRWADGEHVAQVVLEPDSEEPCIVDIDVRIETEARNDARIVAAHSQVGEPTELEDQSLGSRAGVDGGGLSGRS